MIHLFLIFLTPALVFSQELSSPDYFAPVPNYSYQMPEPYIPPAIDVRPTYAYQNSDPAQSTTLMSPTLELSYVYQGANSGDPITVIRPNGTIQYLYPGRVK